ncbi:type II secretion system secretin GspD [Haliea sp.]|uniref:type II secretion system secretin GspD n=1 Tax=Haliea TaxID=475794 RepID=UPI00258021F9|nr:type II secretion system secretin GspD [Haliea sp.]
MNKQLMLVALLVSGLTACTTAGMQPTPPAVATAGPRAESVLEAVPGDSTEQAGLEQGEEDAITLDLDPAVYPGNDRVVRIPAARPPVRLDGEAVSLNFEQAPITEVVHSVLGEILGLDYVVEHPLKGEITLRTRTPVPRDQLLAILESLLQANGITMVRDPNDRYFVSASKGLSSLMPEFGNADTAGAGFRNIIVPLRYISASGMAEILAPVASEAAFVRVDNTRNLLVLAGTSNQTAGWLDIIATFDVDQLQGMSVGIFPLEHSSVEEINAALTHLLGAEGGADGVGASDLARIVRVMPLERLNSILVVTPRAHYIDQIRTWISRLDQSESAVNEPALYVFNVQNGAATHLAEMLSSIFGGSGSGGQRSAADSGVAPGLDSMSIGGNGGSGGGFDAPDTGGSAPAGGSFNLNDEVRIVADEYNNALLVYASRREYLKIESALRKLDVQANQVLIEASILEVTLADDLEFGVEWFLENSLGGGRTGSALLALGDSGNIGGSVPGFSYTITNSAGTVRGVINALAEKSLVNVLSAPSVMVLDNHTAAIHVGDQQPIRSAQTLTDGGTQTTSITYRDTGVKLEVTPSVNAGGLVTMDILQSVTDVGPVDTATDQRSFLERNVSSRVAVRSGESVVLGGLIRDNRSNGRLGIPFLHTIPVLGHLFGKTSTSTSRTELLVFITPRVIRNEQDLRDITLEMRSRMKGLHHFDDLPHGADTGSAGSFGAMGGATAGAVGQPGEQ